MVEQCELFVIDTVSEELPRCHRKPLEGRTSGAKDRWWRSREGGGGGVQGRSKEGPILGRNEVVAGTDGNSVYMW